MSTFVTETSFSVYGMMFRIVTAKILYKNIYIKKKQNKKESRKLIFPHGNKIYIQSSLDLKG